MRYSDLLKTAEWKAFRADYIESRRQPEGESWCDDCGEDTQGTLHVHHKVYRHDVPPWDYDFDEMRLICTDCHKRLHQTEEDWRNFIRALPPHACYEADDLLDALQCVSPELIKVAFGRAKSAVRDVECLHR